MSSEIGIINDVKNIFASIGIGIVSGIFGGAVFPFYEWSKKGKFKIASFIVNMILGAFVGYVVSELTVGFKRSGAMCAVAGALSIKIFEFCEENFDTIISGIVKKRLDIDLDSNKKDAN